MIKNLTTAALSAAFLLCGSGLAFAQSSATHGTTGTTGNSMSTTPSASPSMGSGSTADMTSGSASSQLGGPVTNESQLKKDLQAKGYSDISDIRHEGNYYTAAAKQGGHSVKLRVDASNGSVMQQPG